MKKVIVLAVLAMMLVGGCRVIYEKTPDGEYILKEDVQKTLDIGETIGTTVGGLAPLIDPISATGGAILGIVAAIAGYVARIKPRIKNLENRNEVGAAAGHAVVEAIETLKTVSPKSWESLGPEIEKHLEQYGLPAENFLRELRGLLPKATS